MHDFNSVEGGFARKFPCLSECSAPWAQCKSWAVFPTTFSAACACMHACSAWMSTAAWGPRPNSTGLFALPCRVWRAVCSTPPTLKYLLAAHASAGVHQRAAVLLRHLQRAHPADVGGSAALCHRSSPSRPAPCPSRPSASASSPRVRAIACNAGRLSSTHACHGRCSSLLPIACMQSAPRSACCQVCSSQGCLTPCTNLCIVPPCPSLLQRPHARLNACKDCVLG